MSKLWIIGDSFTGLSSYSKSWVEILCDRYKGDEYFISSGPSRDFQTILDIFLRNLKDISPDDIVILSVPFLGRTRLPLLNPRRGTIIHHPELNNYNDYFIGTPSWTNDQKHLELEHPLSLLEEKEIKDGTQIWSVVNSSTACKENYIEIITSLKQYLPFELYMFSWLDDLICDGVETKSQITQNVGYWHTLYDTWKETNGKDGSEGDGHFSAKMHRGFAEYLTEKFSDFFKKDII